MTSILPFVSKGWATGNVLKSKPSSMGRFCAIDHVAKNKKMAPKIILESFEKFNMFLMFFSKN
jgi:hypothetical protein